MILKLYAVVPVQDITIKGKAYKKGNIAGGIQANTYAEAQALLKKDTFVLQRFIQEYTLGNVYEYGKTVVIVDASLFVILDYHFYFGNLGAQLVKPKNTNAVGYGTFNIYKSDLKTVALKNSSFESAGGSITLNQWYKSRFFTTGLVYNSQSNDKIVNVFCQVQNATKDITGWVNRTEVEFIKSWGDLLADKIKEEIQQPLQKVRDTVEDIQEASGSIVNGVKLAGIGFMLFSLLNK